MSADTSPWSVRFRRERQDTWTELEKLIDACERRGLRRLSSDQLARLPILYRSTLSSLSVARASVLDRSLLEYLESLVSRAYLWVYAPRRTMGQLIAHYLTHSFPSAVRSIRWHVAIATTTLLLGGAIAMALYAHDPQTYYYFVPESMASGRDPDAATETLREMLFGGGDSDLGSFAIFLFTHNSSVSILAYSLGFLFGIPTILLLLYTGLMLGAMTALHHDRGLAVEWWSWILPHGVTELGAICLSGGAALAIAQRLIFPGRYSRTAEIARTGRAMGGVVAGSIGMLFIAGMIEGIFRQAVTDVTVRYSLAAILATCWAAYFAIVGRRTR